ncbi:MAG: hypothetical protein IIY21_28050 [Clostridiales bacterium]|nr:hypothetical protein [Clostridiales bacterium]
MAQIRYVVITKDDKNQIGSRYGYTNIQDARKVAYNYLKKNSSERYISVWILRNGKITGDATHNGDYYTYSDYYSSKIYPLYSSGRIGPWPGT